jgi:hypothetical protein
MKKAQRISQMNTTFPSDDESMKGEGEKLNDLLELARPVYQQTVEAMALDAYRYIRGDVLDHEELTTFLDEKLETHHWVAWTNKAQLVCLLSENNGALFDDDAGTSEWVEGGIDWSKLAYAAMRKDVLKALAEMDVDCDNPEDHLSSWIRRAYDVNVPESVVLWCALHPEMAEELERATEEEDWTTFDQERYLGTNAAARKPWEQTDDSLALRANVALLESALDKTGVTLNGLHELVEKVSARIGEDLLRQEVSVLDELGIELEPEELPEALRDVPTEWTIGHIDSEEE